MKKDGRKLDRKAQEAIRLMVVQRVREGESPSAVIASYGMNRTTIHKWLKQASGKGAGLHKLQARKAPGRPRTLTAPQERQVFRWINGNNPMQYGSDFGLWTRKIVRDLVQREFDHTLSLASIGAMLARLNLTPQKPLQPVPSVHTIMAVALSPIVVTLKTKPTGALVLMEKPAFICAEYQCLVRYSDFIQQQAMGLEHGAAYLARGAWRLKEDNVQYPDSFALRAVLPAG